jgi:hypothetical protein
MISEPQNLPRELFMEPQDRSSNLVTLSLIVPSASSWFTVPWSSAYALLTIDIANITKSKILH